MRRFDKKKNIQKANLLVEQRHLEEKGLIKENIKEADLDEVKHPNLPEPKQQNLTDGPDKYIDSEDILENPENYPDVDNGMIWTHTMLQNLNFGGRKKAMELEKEYLKKLGKGSYDELTPEEKGGYDKIKNDKFKPKNGGVGLYAANAIGKKKGNTLQDVNGTNVHTNELSLMGVGGDGIYFEVNKNMHFNANRGVHAGLGGKLVKSNPSTGTLDINYNPARGKFSTLESPPYFYLRKPQEAGYPAYPKVGDKTFVNLQLIGADSAYAVMDESGNYSLRVKNPKIKEWSLEEFVETFKNKDPSLENYLKDEPETEEPETQSEPDVQVEPDKETEPQKEPEKEPELELDGRLNENNMKNKNRILTESQKKQIIKDKEKAILESFASTFNRIKRIDENEIKESEETLGGIGADQALNDMNRSDGNHGSEGVVTAVQNKFGLTDLTFDTTADAHGDGYLYISAEKGDDDIELEFGVNIELFSDGEIKDVHYDIDYNDPELKRFLTSFISPEAFKLLLDDGPLKVDFTNF